MTPFQTGLLLGLAGGALVGFWLGMLLAAMCRAAAWGEKQR